MKQKLRRSGINIMASLIGMLGKLGYIIIFAVFGGYIGNMCAISVMVLGATAVAKIIDPNVVSCSLSLLVWLTIGAGVLRGLLRFIEQYNNHYIAFKLLANIRDKIFGALRKLAPAKLEGKQKGAIISMLTSDVETLEVFYAHTVSPIMIAILVDGTVFVFITLITNIYLGLIALASYLLIGIAIPFISSALMQKDGVQYRKQFADTSSFFLDSLKGINDTVLNNNQIQRDSILKSQSEYMNKKTIEIKEKSSITSSISNLIVSITILTATAVGTICVINQGLPVSKMIIGLVALFSSFGPVLSLAALPSNLNQTFAAGDRILDFMEEKPVVEEIVNKQDFNFNNLEVSNVSFSYGDVPVLKDVSLNVDKGDIIGIVGASGCGKSTLLRLIMRFYDVDSGTIKYNGINIKDINTNSLLSNIAIVSQDTYLFNDTIINNLKFVKPDATNEEIKDACKKASVDDFIESLENGYDTEVGLLGGCISTGEKRRIGLARAFLSGANLILLDEVTSNVDAINEGIILSSLKNISKEKTIILVSHRESTTAICNKIYKMKDGANNG